MMLARPGEQNPRMFDTASLCLPVLGLACPLLARCLPALAPPLARPRGAFSTPWRVPTLASFV